MIIIFAISLMSVATFTSAAEDITLIYNIDFEELNAGTVMMAKLQNVGEVVEWPKGSGNHALKYIMDSTTYKSNGIHPYIIPDGLSDALAQQGDIPFGGGLYFTVDVGCNDQLRSGNPEYNINGLPYMYSMMLTADEGENYFANETGHFYPGVGSFNTGGFSLSRYEVTPRVGTTNGAIALLDDGTLGAGMNGKAIYYDNITLEWYGDWKPVTDCLLTYRDTKVPLAHSDINDAYYGKTSTSTTTSTTAVVPEPQYGENLIINADCFESDSASPAFGWNVLSGNVRIDGAMMIYNDGVTSSKVSIGLKNEIKPNTEYMFNVGSVSGDGAQLVVNGLEGEYSRTYFGVGDGPICFKTPQDTSAVSFMVYVEAFAGVTDTIVLDNFVLSEILNGENSEESESETEISTTSTTTSTTSSTSTTTSTINTTSTTTTTIGSTEPTMKIFDMTTVTTATGTENYGGSEPTAFFESEPDMILGDATDDGRVDMKDVLLIRKALAGISDIKNSLCADANKDGSLDMKDVLLIRKFLANLAVL